MLSSVSGKKIKTKNKFEGRMRIEIKNKQKNNKTNNNKTTTTKNPTTNKQAKNPPNHPTLLHWKVF